MGIIQDIKNRSLSHFDVFRWQNALELKLYFGKYYPLFRTTFQRCPRFYGSVFNGYELLRQMIEVIEKKIDLYDFSPDNLGKIPREVLVTFLDENKKTAALLIEAFRTPGVKASLSCFTMSKNQDGFAFLLESLKSAGNQLGVFEAVFSGFHDASDEFRKMIIPQVVLHEFYRYKFVVESIAGGVGLHYPIDNPKAFMLSLQDILSGKIQKYLVSEDGKIVLMLLSVLPQVDAKAYTDYFLKMLQSPIKIQRFMALYHTSQRRLDKLKIVERLFIQDDLEMYSPLLECLESYRNPELSRLYTRNANNDYFPLATKIDIYRKLYHPLIALWNRLPKRTVTYPVSEAIWFAHSVKEEDIIAKIIHILDQTNDIALIRHFEENHYERLTATDKLLFITALKGRIKLDYRTEMLQYFGTTGYFRADYHKYFVAHPLTFDEALIVASFLKSKKTEIKKNIVEHFARMPLSERARLKDALAAAQEEYKQEIAKDIQVDTLTKPKTTPEPLPKHSLDAFPLSRTKDILSAIRAEIFKHANVEVADSMGEKRLFGTFWYMPENADGSYYFEDEVKAVFQSFQLSDDETIALMERIYTAEEDRQEATLFHKAEDEKTIELCTLLSGYIDRYLSKFIKTNQSATMQTAILKRLSNLYAMIGDPVKLSREMQRSGQMDQSSQRIWNSRDMKLFSQVKDIASLISHEDSTPEHLREMKRIVDYVLAIGAYRANPLSDPILIPQWWSAGMIDRAEIMSLFRLRLFAFHRFFAQKNRSEDDYKPVDMNILLAYHMQSDDFVLLMEGIQNEMLDVELQRGQAETPYSGILTICKRIIGIAHYPKLLQAFQTMTLPRSPSGLTIDNAFASYLECLEPHKNDTYEMFCQGIEELGLTEEDLIKGVLYNNHPTVLDWTARRLNKPGFLSCVLFFKAHLRDSEVAMGLRDRIALFSPIDIADFREGAVDTDWFYAMKAQIDEATFRRIYANAKYITVANFHTRAQRFTDALTGILTVEECLDKIHTTRNKDYLLSYSLIPLKDANEAFERYVLIQTFLQESKQFGAQRQTSEKKACEIALENIARGAGYDDPDRFVWQMESKEASRILPFFISSDIDGIQINLHINDHYKVALAATNQGKVLASLPAKLKSHPEVLARKAELPVLNKQSARVIRSLESAMERDVSFTESEIKQIAVHPVIKSILQALFFVANNDILTFDGLAFHTLDGEATSIEAVVIAHPYDFLRLKRWEAVQRYLMQNHIRQPFKQGFREYYPMTADEIEAKETNRYHGHQISVHKAIAVGKNRGWHTGEDIGLQKVFYRENLVAVLFGVWDFGYSSFDDHPTLSSVYFLNRKADETGKMKIIPLKNVKPKIFSEVMRDIDLIVATSHPLGYDFEESLSTVEVRRQICASIIDLLALKNVSIVGHHIHIQGTYGEYAIHLKTGNAYKQLSGALNIMAINDSTHNKLFLPFVDDNPKTAEVVSKMLLLAEDKKIKDSNIVKEIKG